MPEPVPFSPERAAAAEAYLAEAVANLPQLDVDEAGLVVVGYTESFEIDPAAAAEMQNVDPLLGEAQPPRRLWVRRRGRQQRFRLPLAEISAVSVWLEQSPLIELRRHGTRPAILIEIADLERARGIADALDLLRRAPPNLLAVDPDAP